MAYASTRLALQFGVVGTNQQIINWEDYIYDSDFLTPCDAFSMRVGDKSVTPDMRKLMRGGQQIKLFVQFLDTSGNVVSQNPIFTGFLDKVDQSNDRNGTFFTLRGRNILGPLCDSGIDPWSNRYKFVEGQTLGDVMGKVFNTFDLNNIFLTDAENRSVTTGVDKSHAKLQSKIIKVTKDDIVVGPDGIETKSTVTDQVVTEWIDPTNIYDLQEKSVKKLQPKHNETFMQFVLFNLARFHLHCWALSDGTGVVIAQPDYNQEPLFKITNKLNGQGNNIISGRVEIDYSTQPSLIIAKGFQGGGDFQNTRIRTCKVNEFIGYPVYNTDGDVIGPIAESDGTYTPLPEVNTIIKSFKGLKPLAPNIKLAQNYSKYFTPPAVPRVLYWEDPQSRTLDQLQGAVQRKMSEYQKNAFKLHYTVQDHIQNGLVWKHNTIVTVTDETLGINGQNFWVLSVSFKKSRNAGTTTDLVLIPVGTLQFGPL